MPDVANRFRPRGPPGQVEFHLRKGQLVKLGTQGAESKHQKNPHQKAKFEIFPAALCGQHQLSHIVYSAKGPFEIYRN